MLLKLIEFDPVKRVSAEDALSSAFFETKPESILINRNSSEDDVNTILSAKITQIPLKINLDGYIESTKLSSNRNSTDSNDQNKSSLKIPFENIIIPVNLLNDKIGKETPLFKEQTSGISDIAQTLFAKDKIMDQDSLYLDISLPLLTGNLNTINNDSKTSEFNSFNNSKFNMGAFSPIKSKFSTESPVNMVRSRRKSTNDENTLLKASILKNLKSKEIDDKIIKFEVLNCENSLPIHELNSGKSEEVEQNNNQIGGFSDLVKQYNELIELKDEENNTHYNLIPEINDNNIEMQYSNIPPSQKATSREDCHN